MAIIGALPVTLVNGTVGDAAQVMSDLNYISAQVNANAAATAGGNTFTGVQVVPTSAARTSPPQTAQVQDGAFNYAADTSAVAGTIQAALVPPVISYATGGFYWIKVAVTNTGAATLALNGMAAKAVQNTDGSVLQPNQLLANGVYGFQYTGTLFTLINPSVSGIANNQGTITGNISIVVADFPSTKKITATATMTLPPASTVVAGKSITLKSLTTGDVQLAPNGADTIDGVNANVRIPSYDAWTIESDGVSAWLITRRGSHNIGDMTESAAASAPLGWAACDASLVRTTYAGLFAVIGTTFGNVDGSHFNTPQRARRVGVGAGGSGTATLGNAVGNTGGEETHALSVAELAAHSHTTSVDGSVIMLGESGSSNSSGGGNWLKPGAAFSMANAGSGTAHNNIQPSIVMNYYIKT